MPERNAARCAIGNSSDCDRNTATRSPRTRPSAFSTLAKRRDMLRDLVERGARGRTVLIDIDQRQPAGAVRMTIAARGRHVETRGDVPAEVAIELVVGGGFGEHGGRPSRRSSWPGLSRPSRSCFCLILKTWVPGTSPGMTAKKLSSRHRPYRRGEPFHGSDALFEPPAIFPRPVLEFSVDPEIMGPVMGDVGVELGLPPDRDQIGLPFCRSLRPAPLRG